MSDNEQIITETEWGLHIINPSGLHVTGENVKIGVERVINKCLEAKKNKMLVESQGITRDVSIPDMYQVGELLQKLGAIGFRIAIVAPQLKELEASKFMETVSFNRGSFVQYFSDKDEALEWLLE